MTALSQRGRTLRDHATLLTNAAHVAGAYEQDELQRQLTDLAGELRWRAEANDPAG